MSTEECKNRLTWGVMLLIGALGCASLRNNPALGVSPFAIGVIDCLIMSCILIAVRFSSYKMAVVIGVVIPVYLWAQRFLDGFMIPVDIAVHLTLVLCMHQTLSNGWKDWINVLILTVAGFGVLIVGSAIAIWLVKQEHIVRSVLSAWNTKLYSIFSILGAAIISVWFKKKVE